VSNTDGASVSLIVSGSCARSISERWDRPDPTHSALLSLLLRRGSRRVVLGGVVTNFAVESTARYSDDAGFAVTVIEDCRASPNPEWHAFTVEKMLPLFGELVSAGAFVAGVSGAAS
jgi:nicotinamidase-related amidase